MKYTYGNKSGFTIVELIVVITVIGILAAIGITSYAGMQNRAKKSSFESNAQQLKLKLGEYMTDKNGYPRTGADVLQYLNDTGATALATEASSGLYQYVPTGCPAAPGLCTGYTITVAKSAWNGDAADTNIVVSP